MKTLVYLALAASALTFTACNKDSVNPQSDLTTIANARLTTTAGGSTTGTAGQMPGAPPKLTEIKISDLPAAITDYIKKTFTTAEVKKAGKDEQGNYVVGLAIDGKPKGLVFDAQGNFKEEAKPMGPGGPGMGTQGPGRPPKPEGVTEIKASELPDTITDYVKKTYPTAEIKLAGKDKDGNFMVGLKVDEKPLGLLFDAQGNFKQELKPQGPPPPSGK